MDNIHFVLIKEEGQLEVSVDGINFLSSLNTEKLKTYSKLEFSEEDDNIDKDKGLFLSKKTESTDEGKIIKITAYLYKDMQNAEKKEINEKLILLSSLISTCIEFSTDLLPQALPLLKDLPLKITDDEVKQNTQKYLPYIISDISEEEKKNLAQFYPKLEKEIEPEKIPVKKVDNILIDGETLFGLTQNYIETINYDFTASVKQSLKKVLLSKAKAITERNFDNFKQNFVQPLEKTLPIPFEEIYSKFFAYEKKEIASFTSEVKDFLPASESYQYLTNLIEQYQNEVTQLTQSNSKLIESTLENDIKDFESVNELHNTAEDLKNVDEIAESIGSFSDEILEFFTKLVEIAPNIELIKKSFGGLCTLVNKFICARLTQFSNKIQILVSVYKNTKETEASKAEVLSKELDEKLNNLKKLYDDTNKKNSELNKELCEINAKYGKLERDAKVKAVENENNTNLENQKFQKMETYYNDAIKEKDDKIAKMKEQINKLTSDHETEKQALQTKISQMEKMANKDENEGSPALSKKKEKEETVQNHDNLSSLFNSINQTFLEFKTSMDAIIKNNDTTFQIEMLEQSTKSIENKSHSWIEQIKSFRNEQIKTLRETFEQSMKKSSETINSLTFELATTSTSLTDAKMQLTENEQKISSMENQIKMIDEISKGKDSLVTKQKEEIGLLNTKMAEFVKKNEDLEHLYHKIDLDCKMKEDELDTLLMVIDSLLSQKKDKYLHNVNRLSDEGKEAVEKYVREYKVFKY